MLQFIIKVHHKLHLSSSILTFSAALCVLHSSRSLRLLTTAEIMRRDVKAGGTSVTERVQNWSEQTNEKKEGERETDRVQLCNLI